MIVRGTRDNSFRETFLRECDLTLFKAISAGQAAEFTDLNLPLILIKFLTRNSISLVKALATRT